MELRGLHLPATGLENPTVDLGAGRFGIGPRGLDSAGWSRCDTPRRAAEIAPTASLAGEYETASFSPTTTVEGYTGCVTTSAVFSASLTGEREVAASHPAHGRGVGGGIDRKRKQAHLPPQLRLTRPVRWKPGWTLGSLAGLGCGLYSGREIGCGRWE